LLVVSCNSAANLHCRCVLTASNTSSSSSSKQHVCRHVSGYHVP
jgi:hypothetical protein